MPKKLGQAVAVFRYSYVGNRISKREARDKVEQSLRGRAIVTDVQEYPEWHSWFYIVTLEVRDESLPCSSSPPFPAVDWQTGEAITQQQIQEWAEKQFAAVRPRFRCPLCWNRHKGKPLVRDNANNKGRTIIRFNLQCDACGTRWLVKIRRGVDTIIDSTIVDYGKDYGDDIV